MKANRLSSSKRYDEETETALRFALSAIRELTECAGESLTYDAEMEAEIAERKIRDVLGKKQ